MSASSQNPFVHTSRCPIVRSAEFDLTMLVDVTGERRMEPLHFRHAVQWLRESSTTVHLFGLGGELRKQCETHSDFYGFLTSVADQVSDAKARARRMGAAPASNAEVTAVVTLEDSPVIKAQEDDRRGYHGAKARFWIGVPTGWLIRDDARLEAWRGSRPGQARHDVFREWPRLERISTDHVAWSSAWSDGEGDGELSRLRERALAGLAPEDLAQASARLASALAAEASRAEEDDGD